MVPEPSPNCWNGEDEEQKIDECKDAPILYSLHYPDQTRNTPMVSKQGNEKNSLFNQMRSIMYAGPREIATKDFSEEQAESEIKDKGNQATLRKSAPSSDRKINSPPAKLHKEPRGFTAIREKSKLLQNGLRTMVSSPPALNDSSGTAKGSTFLLETLDSDYGLLGQNLLPPIPFYWTGAPISSSPNRVVIMFADAYGMSSGNHKIVADEIAKLMGEERTAVMIPDLSRGHPLLHPYTNISTATLGTMLVRLKLKNRPERVERDLKEMLFPWLASQFDDISKVTFSCIGFCHGAWIMARALAIENTIFDCGVGIHPSFIAEEVHGGSSESLAQKIGSNPCLLMPASNNKDLKAFSKATLVLAKARGEKMSEIVRDFDTMLHGWVSRGDRTDEEIAKKQIEALEAATAFICRHSN